MKTNTNRFNCFQKIILQVHIMSDQEPTRWLHNCIHVYPQPISLCECMIVIYDSVNITCVIRMHAYIVSRALLNNCGPADCCLFT